MSANLDNAEDSVISPPSAESATSDDPAPHVPHGPTVVVIFRDRIGRDPLYVSPGIRDLLGWDQESFRADIADLIHPEDMPPLIESVRHLRSAVGNSANRLCRMRHADGTWRWLELTGLNLMEDPEVRGVVATMRDVSEELAVRARQLDSERRFRKLVQNGSDVTVVLDDEARFTWISPVIERVLGYRVEDLLDTPVLDIVHPTEHDDVLQRLFDNSGPESFDGEDRTHIRRSDGVYRHFGVTITDLRDDPDIAGLVLNCRDITEREETREALEQSEARLQVTVENIVDIVMLSSANGTISWVSPSASDSIGHRPEDVVGRTALRFIPAEERPRLIEAYLAVRATPGKTTMLVHRLKRGDGSIVWVETTLANRLDDPAIGAIVSTYRDVTARIEADNALRESEHLFRTLASSSPMGIFTLDGQGRCTWVNERWQQITGYTAERAVGRNWLDLLAPEHRPAIARQLEQACSDEVVRADDFQWQHADGGERWGSAMIAPMPGGEGRSAGGVGTLEDITDRVATMRTNARFQSVLAVTSDLVCLFDSRQQLIYINRAARDFFGLPVDGGTDQFEIGDRIAPEHREQWSAVLADVERTGGLSGELTFLDSHNERVPMSTVLTAQLGDDGEVSVISAVARDISERRELEQRLEHEATHDPLTGLPNRTLLLDRLEVALKRTIRSHLRTATLFLDLDRFKVVNDTLGHPVGDQVLVALAERLRATLRPGDTIARFGGDEFVLLCEDLESEEEAFTIADRVAEAVKQPIQIEGDDVFVSASIGISFAGEEANPEEMLRNADSAMYQAKDRGRARSELFDSRMRSAAVDRRTTENDLRRAVERRELRVLYQPTINLLSGKIVGAEALLRWEHPERGLLGPAEFLTIAEESRLIVPIGRWMMDHACRELERVHSAANSPDLVLSINLSARQLEHVDLLKDLERLLREISISAAHLDLEITEHVLMHDVLAAKETLEQLKGLGLELAVDDFGTGYSSLSHLRRFPVDVLKVDQSFVDGLGVDPSDSAITAAVISLAHTLGLTAIAEGVETPLQLAELRRLNCDMAQGFLMSRPITADALIDLVLEDVTW